MGIFSKLFEFQEDWALREKLLAKIPNPPISLKDYFHDIHVLSEQLTPILGYDTSQFANIIKQMGGSVNIETLYGLTEAKEYLTQRRAQINSNIKVLEEKTASYLDDISWYEDEASLSVFHRQRDMVDQRIANPWSTIYHYYWTYWCTRPLNIKATKIPDAMRAVYSHVRAQQPLCNMCIEPERLTGCEEAHTLWILQTECLEVMNVTVRDKDIVDGFRKIVTLIDSNMIRVRLRFDLASHLPVHVSCEGSRYVIHLPTGFLDVEYKGSIDNYSFSISNLGRIALNGALFGRIFFVPFDVQIENSTSAATAECREALRLAAVSDQDPGLSGEELIYLQSSIGYELYDPSRTLGAEMRKAFLSACPKVGQEVRRLKANGRLCNDLAKNRESAMRRLQSYSYVKSELVPADLRVSESAIDLVR